MRSGIALCGLLALAGVTISVGFATAATKPHLVVAKVPLGQSVQDLLNDRFVELVTCRQVCTVTTRAAIRPGVARKLGFKGVVAGKWASIGTASQRLKAKKLTKVTIHLNAQAKKLLPRAKSGLQVAGFVDATAVANRSVRGSAVWNVTCSWR